MSWKQLSHADCTHDDEYSARRVCRSKRRKEQPFPEITIRTSYCGKCKTEKPVKDFARKREATTGIHYTCKSCIRTSKHNITKAEKAQRLIEQGNKCKICQRVCSRYVADHNHTTGEFRGMLCYGCNIGVGWLENRVWRKRAIAYIRGEL